MSISHLKCTLTFGFRASLNSELDVQFLLGYYFKVFFRDPTFWHFNIFSTHLEIHDNFVCVCVEMLFLKNFTRCCGQWNMVLKVMVWEWGIKRNNRGWLCENLANKKNLKSLLQSVSLTLKKKLAKFWITKIISLIFEDFENVRPFQTNSNWRKKMKCFSSMEKDNQIKLKISWL